MRAFLLSLAIVVVGCEGPAGPAGAPGAGQDGSDGRAGDPGSKGDPGDPGATGASPWLTSPGVKLSITGLTFAGSTATVAFTLTDGKGVGLDRAGLFTDGTVSIGFALAQLAQNADGSAAQYTAYTTRTQTTPDGQHSAVQGAAESSGTFAVVDLAHGRYTYTFVADLSAHDVARTQTVAGNVTRTMTSGAQYLDAADFSTGPSATPVTRQVVSNAACNGCHGQLSAHGGHWKATTQCVLCHQPQSSDPDTGNTVDFRVMVHKIHRGDQLPSVKAGGAYHIVGYGQVDHDFSTVAYPQPISRCESCHADDAAQADAWKTSPSIPACTSCHDTTVFAQADVVPGKTVLHSGLEQNEGSCGTCHRPGSIHPIEQRHHTGTLDPSQPQLAVTIDGITSGGPGQSPAVAFTVTDHGVGRDLSKAPLTTLTATIAGPNRDYASYWQWKLAGGTGTLTAIDAAAGKFQYQFAANQIIPANATGSYTLGLEASWTDPATSVRYAAVGPTAPFAVTDAIATPRRTIVDGALCNQCHADLSAHGGGRKGAAYCALCHQPGNFNDERVARFETPSTILAESVDLKVYIHKIHMGERLSEPYVLGAFPAPSSANPAGTPTHFDETRYPRDVATCTACHTGTTYQVPAAGVLPSLIAQMACTEPPDSDANNYCDAPYWSITQTTPLATEVAVCTSCHDAPYVAVHAALNTTTDGKTACATCHGPGKDEDVRVVHHLD